MLRTVYNGSQVIHSAVDYSPTSPVGTTDWQSTGEEQTQNNVYYWIL